VAVTDMLFDLQIIVVAHRKSVLVRPEVFEAAIYLRLWDNAHCETGFVLDAVVASSFV